MYNSYQEKSSPHFSWGDWTSYNRSLETVTEKSNIIGNNVRQESMQLRNAVDNTMTWKFRDTNQKLGDRINDVEQWFRNLDRTLREVQEAVDRLSEAKVETERTIANNLPLHEAAKECLNHRDRRREVDLVEDEVYHEVKKEVDLIHKINNALRDCASHNFDHLIQLKEQRDKLEADLKDKELALRIDRFQLSLNPTSTDTISLKPWPADACSAGQCPVSLETWLRNSEDRRKAAENEVARANRAVNDTWNLIRKSTNDIRYQREATQFALRKRRHETLQLMASGVKAASPPGPDAGFGQARDQLAAQRKDLKDEIERLDKEMLTIEQAINESRGNLKLVHTRLEHRKDRPGFELCRDNPTVGLEEELRHVVESREYLAQKLRDVKNMLNRIQLHLHEVEDDLRRKEHSLAIETSCIEIHENPAKAPYQTDIAWLAPLNTTATSNYLNESVKRGSNKRILDRHAAECFSQETAAHLHSDNPEYRLED